MKTAISPPTLKTKPTFVPQPRDYGGRGPGNQPQKKPNPLRTKTLRTNPKTKPSENKTVGAVHLNRLGD